MNKKLTSLFALIALTLTLSFSVNATENGGNPTADPDDGDVIERICKTVKYCRRG